MKKLLLILSLLFITSCRTYVNHKSPIQKQNDWWVGEYHMLQPNGLLPEDHKKLIIGKSEFHITGDSTNDNSFKITSTYNSKIISNQTSFIYVDERKYKTNVIITITPDLYQQKEERWAFPDMNLTSTLEWGNPLIKIK